MPQFDVSTYSSTLFWLLISLGTVMVYYLRFVLPRYNATIELRLHTIRYDLEQAAKLNTQARELSLTCTQRIAEAQHQADEMFEKTCYELEEKGAASLATLKSQLAEKRKAIEAVHAQKQQELEKLMTAETAKAAQLIFDQISELSKTVAASTSSDHMDDTL